MCAVKRRPASSLMGSFDIFGNTLIPFVTKSYSLRGVDRKRRGKARFHQGGHVSICLFVGQKDNYELLLTCHCTTFELLFTWQQVGRATWASLSVYSLSLKKHEHLNIHRHNKNHFKGQKTKNILGSLCVWGSLVSSVIIIQSTV